MRKRRQRRKAGGGGGLTGSEAASHQQRRRRWRKWRNNSCSLCAVGPCEAFIITETLHNCQGRRSSSAAAASRKISATHKRNAEEKNITVVVRREGGRSSRCWAPRAGRKHGPHVYLHLSGSANGAAERASRASVKPRAAPHRPGYVKKPLQQTYGSRPDSSPNTASAVYPHSLSGAAEPGGSCFLHLGQKSGNK